MKEIRLHGRGGQGAVTASRILAVACVFDGKHVSGFPLFGTERRGAPVTAFVRFDDKPVRENTHIYEPDCLIIMDPNQAKSVSIFSGLKGDGTVVFTTSKLVVERPNRNVGVIGFVDAMAIGLQEIGRAIPNTCLLGCFAKTTEWITLDSILLSLKEYFKGSALQANANCVQKGFERTKIIKIDGY